MATNWSKYQNDVFDFVLNKNGSAVVSAVAGSGKTTTIVECAKRIPSDKSVLFLAFNKSIVNELTERLKMYRNVTCCTTHSLGLKAIFKGCGKVKMFDGKWYMYIRDNVSMLSSIITDDTDDGIKREFVRNTSTILSKCRINLIKSGEIDKIRKIVIHHSLDTIADEINVVDTLLSQAYKLANGEKTIDYIDMLTLPITQFKSKLSRFDYVFIDECQD